MALIQLIYTSSLVKDAPDVLHSILDVAVRKNKQLDVTGMLLCSEGNIMQVLEGAREAVLDIFKAIQADKRHHDIYVLSQDEVPERQFAAWSMGFKRITTPDASSLPSATPAFETRKDEITLRVNAGAAQELLGKFARDL